MTDSMVSQRIAEYANRLLCEQSEMFELTDDHLTLLRTSSSGWNDTEFGAASIEGKRPYGNRDVEMELERLLPHLSARDRLRVHAECIVALPICLARIAIPAGRFVKSGPCEWERKKPDLD